MTPTRWRSAPAARWSKQGGDSWFFLTADYAFGYSLEEQTGNYVKENGGTGSSARSAIRWRRTDFSSFLLQAQSSGAKVIGLANAGLDTANAIKQAAEFGIVAGGQRLAALLFTLAEVHGLGLEAAQGLTLTEGFYWNRNDESRAFGKRFFDRTGEMPNMVHAGTYSAVTQYLKAIEKAGTDDTDAVAKATARTAGRRRLRPERQGCRQRSHDPRHVPDAGQEARRKRRPVGLLHRLGDHPRRRGLHRPGQERLRYW